MVGVVLFGLAMLAVAGVASAQPPWVSQQPVILNSGPPSAFAEPTPTPVSTAPEDRIVFIRGYASQWPPLSIQVSDGPDVFATIKQELLSRGWSSNQFIEFSYAGGAVIDGEWLPNPYGCVDTAQGIWKSGLVLGDILESYKAQRPNARFVLVGHSLGGVIAWTYVHYRHSFGEPDLGVAGVITLHSTLTGIEPLKTSVMELATLCAPASNATVDNLQDLAENRASWQSLWSNEVVWAQDRGMRLQTLGSQNDCVFDPETLACLVAALDVGEESSIELIFSDERESQYIDPIAQRTDAPIGDSIQASHRALLDQPGLYEWTTDWIEWAMGRCC